MFHSMVCRHLLVYHVCTSVVVCLVCHYLTAVTFFQFLLLDCHDVHGRRNRVFGVTNEELLVCTKEINICMYTGVDSSGGFVSLRCVLSSDIIYYEPLCICIWLRILNMDAFSSPSQLNQRQIVVRIIYSIYIRVGCAYTIQHRLDRYLDSSKIK